MAPLEVILAYPGFHARQLHRLAHTLHNAGVPVLPRVISHFSRLITGIEIHPGAQIGEGSVHRPRHGRGDRRDGDHRRQLLLYQGVTLGGTSTRREKRHPTLLEGVSVGAGAKVIGAVTSASTARIGAGSVVVTSVPAYATVVGVPGHVVAYYDPGNGTTVRLPDPEWDRIDELTPSWTTCAPASSSWRTSSKSTARRLPATDPSPASNPLRSLASRDSRR